MAKSAQTAKGNGSGADVAALMATFVEQIEMFEVGGKLGDHRAILTVQKGSESKDLRFQVLVSDLKIEEAMTLLAAIGYTYSDEAASPEVETAKPAKPTRTVKTAKPASKAPEPELEPESAEDGGDIEISTEAMAQIEKAKKLNMIASIVASDTGIESEDDLVEVLAVLRDSNVSAVLTGKTDDDLAAAASAVLETDDEESEEEQLTLSDKAMEEIAAAKRIATVASIVVSDTGIDDVNDVIGILVDLREAGAASILKGKKDDVIAKGVTKALG